ncbi:MAG: putative toxin-antitoxin system toxin component, PIN family [Candidatus Woesearchaeota archaeon]
MRVVIDTNVFISGLFWMGAPNSILELWKKRLIQNITSEMIINEINTVLKSKHINVPEELRVEIVELVVSNSIIVYPTKIIRVSRDITDNKFIEAAIEGKAEYVISGDKDLLSLKEYGNIVFISPTDFLKKYYCK